MCMRQRRDLKRLEIICYTHNSTKNVKKRHKTRLISTSDQENPLPLQRKRTSSAQQTESRPIV